MNSKKDSAGLTTFFGIIIFAIAVFYGGYSFGHHEGVMDGLTACEYMILCKQAGLNHCINGTMRIVG